MRTEFSEVFALSVEKKLELLGELWDSITESPQDVPVPEWHLAELDRREAGARAESATRRTVGGCQTTTVESKWLIACLFIQTRRRIWKRPVIGMNCRSLDCRSISWPRYRSALIPSVIFQKCTTPCVVRFVEPICNGFRMSCISNWRMQLSRFARSYTANARHEFGSVV